MKNKVIFFLTIFFLIFVFFTFYIGLNKPSLYKPKSEIKDIPKFSVITFFENKKLNSDDIFNKDKFYLLNIWASWCVPCREEHKFLDDLSKINFLEIIGLNYKDNFENGKKFLDELGNPYNKVLVDKDGTIAIYWSAFGVPESFLIYNDEVIKRYIGPLNEESVEEIKKILK